MVGDMHLLREVSMAMVALTMAAESSSEMRMSL